MHREAYGSAHLRAVIGIAALFTALVAVAAPQAVARTDNRSKPIVFVHGMDGRGQPGHSCFGDDGHHGSFGAMKDKLRKLGFTGPFDGVKFYKYDWGCTSNISSQGGNPGAHYPSGHYLDGQHSADTDIRHLAYHIAWHIYNRYSSNGTAVDVVTLSMSGLPVRYAVAQTELHDPDFPPFLMVEDAVLYGSPHGGPRSDQTFDCPYLQCRQQAKGSELLLWLEANAWEPDGVGGTDWTAFGANSDSLVSGGSATGTNSTRSADRYFGACHKVIYDLGVGHGDYAFDTSSAKNLPAMREVSMGCGGQLIHKGAYYHPVVEGSRGLRYGFH